MIRPLEIGASTAILIIASPNPSYMDEAPQGWEVIAVILVAAALTVAAVTFVLLYDREPECCEKEPAAVKQCVGLTPSQADALLRGQSDNSDLTVIDVRTDVEYGAGHIEGAILHDYYADDFWDWLSGFDRNGTYLLYCQDGVRSLDTCSVMDSMEFTDVREITGGFAAWEGAGFPVEQ